jgi:hypothetical protein
MERKRETTMNAEERKGEVFDRVEKCITRLRLIRSTVQKGKHVDHTDVMELLEFVASLRHHCDQHNSERLYPKEKGKPLADIL